MRKEYYLTAIAKKLCSSSHGKIQLKLFAVEAALKPTILEKNTVVAKMARFNEISIDIIGFAKKRRKNVKYPYS